MHSKEHRGEYKMNQTPYWIIVSDEGPSSFPYKHETYDSAYSESIRLAKIKPGLKFNIFKFEGYSVATEPKVQHYVAAQNLSVTRTLNYPWVTFQRNESIPF
jgi:hypothetical protein